MPMGTQTDSLLCHSCDSKTKCMQMLFQYAKAWGGGNPEALGDFSLLFPHGPTVRNSDFQTFYQLRGLWIRTIDP